VTDRDHLLLDDVNWKLEEVNILFYDEFGSMNCKALKDMSHLASRLERLTVTYVAVMEQLRRFELKNCKGKVKNMMKSLEERFDERLGVEKPHFVIEGSEYDQEDLSILNACVPAAPRI